jgi:hypothetical protein
VPKRRAFSYDGWGNINGQTWTPGQAAAPGTMSRGPSDANGNFVGGTGYPGVYGYDVENRMVSQPNSTAPAINGIPVAGWGYDPWGKRVVNCCALDGGGGDSSVSTFYGVDGRALGRYLFAIHDDGTYGISFQGTNLYFGGTLIQSNGETVATDRLGSVRANANGETFAYYPYGMERKLPPGNTITPDGREKFGTYFRDSEYVVGQDYADQRYDITPCSSRTVILRRNKLGLLAGSILQRRLDRLAGNRQCSRDRNTCGL